MQLVSVHSLNLSSSAYSSRTTFSWLFPSILYNEYFTRHFRQQSNGWQGRMSTNVSKLNKTLRKFVHNREKSFAPWQREPLGVAFRLNKYWKACEFIHRKLKYDPKQQHEEKPLNRKSFKSSTNKINIRKVYSNGNDESVLTALEALEAFDGGFIK